MAVQIPINVQPTVDIKDKEVEKEGFFFVLKASEIGVNNILQGVVLLCILAFLAVTQTLTCKSTKARIFVAFHRTKKKKRTVLTEASNFSTPQDIDLTSRLKETKKYMMKDLKKEKPVNDYK